MLQHNLILIYRGFKRFRSTFIINLVGLSTGLASALLIYLWVNDELTMDKFHQKDDRLYLIMERGKGIGVPDQTSGPVANVLAQEMPEVEYAAAVAPSSWRGFDSFILSVDDHTINATGQFVGKSYFKMFSYELVNGNPDQVLTDKNSIVISEKLALRLFKTTENVVGKTVVFQQEQQFQVSGVFKNISASSSVQFDFVLSFEKCEEMKPWVMEWNSVGPTVYVLLREGTDPEKFNQKIAGLIQDKTGGEVKDRHLFISRYSDHYLYGNYENGVQSGGRIEYVRLFSVIALFILVIACINFMNLSTAKASARIKEVGVRKALGAGRKRLAIQYMGESMLMTVLSLITAIAIVGLVLPQFNLITEKQLELRPDVRLVISLAGITLFTGLIAGSYPALYLSGFNPVSVLRGKLNSSVGEVWVRKGLVAFQFTLSIILIVLVLVVYEQIDFVQRQNLGYNKDNVIYFDIEGRVKNKPEVFLSELKKIPGILNAASTTHDMVGHNWSVGLNWEGKDPDDHTKFQLMGVSHDFLETMGMEMKVGRFFSRDFSSDTTKTIINEAAAEAIGFDDPIGRKLSGIEIMGIVKNFHFMSFRERIEPQVFILHLRFAQPTLIMARIEAGKETETLERLNKFYRSYNPGFPLDYTFLDDEYQGQYVSERRVSTLSRYFAGLAIVISCLGLFGLAAFTVQRRLKEIGIRKVCGSTDFGIVRLLSGDFTRIVLLAIAIALPISFFMARKWLDGFAFRIDLEWWFFVGSGVLALFIAWFTVGLQTIKAARVNPAQCLKDE